MNTEGGGERGKDAGHGAGPVAADGDTAGRSPDLGNGSSSDELRCSKGVHLLVEGVDGEDRARRHGLRRPAREMKTSRGEAWGGEDGQLRWRRGRDLVVQRRKGTTEARAPWAWIHGKVEADWVDREGEIPRVIWDRVAVAG